MANEFVARNGIIAKDNSTITGTLAVSGNITMGGVIVATRTWVTGTALIGYATESYVTTAINNLIDSAPGALNTLNELAAALGDDPNFATTITNSIGAKLSLSGGTMTGNVGFNTTGTGLSWTMNTDGAYIMFYNTGDGDTNSRLEYGTSDNGNEFHRWMVSTTEEMTLKSDGLRVTDSIWMGGNLVATQSWVTSQNYLTTVPDEYLTQTEGDALYAAISHTHSATDITSGTLAAARLSGNYAINVTGSAATLTTARTLTIGNTGKTFNGSANVSWSLSEIGAIPSRSGIVQSGGVVDTTSLFPYSITTAQTAIGFEYNVLLNAQKKGYTVTQSGTGQIGAPFNLFDGRLEPNYSGDGVNPADPFVLLIEGLPNVHSQTGGVFGWTCRYWVPTIYKVEAFDSYNNVGWKTLVNQQSALATKDLVIPIFQSGFSGALTKFRITIYDSNGSTGANGFRRWGISEIFFIHPEAQTTHQFLDVEWAKKLSTARTIGGVSFDGSADINLPGVNTTGNQNTTGSAATLTTARTLTIGNTGKTFNGSANVSWSLAEIGAQAALTNPVTGTGTTNYLPKLTGATTIGNSQVFDNGTNVGINTASPGFKLDVNGSANFTGFNINSINQITAGAYIEPIVSSGSWSRTSTVDEWVKIISVSGSPRRIRLALNAGGDNTNMYDEFMISHSGYQMQTHIYRLPGSRYNTSKVAGIKVINPTGSTQEVWVKLYGMTTPPGTFTYSANVAVLDAATVAASSQAAEPTGITGSSVLLFDTFDRNDYTTMSSSGGYFGGKGYFGGNVGVGTTSPAYKLDVAGTISNNSEQNFIYATYDDVAALFQRVGTFGAVIKIGRKGVSNSTTIDYPADGTFAVSTAGLERLRITSAGNLGIGTTSPARKLDVAGSVQLSYSDPVLTLYDTGASSYGTTNARVEFNNSYATVGYIEQTGEALRVASTGGSSSVSLFTNGSDRLFVNSSGNVGIGTTSPAGKLHIADDGPNALRIGDTQVSTIGETNDGGYPGMKIVPYNSNIHIGISSTNDNKINLWYGGTNYTYWQQLSTYSIFSNYSTNALALQIHGGNVGIGVTNPSTKLDVNGVTTANGLIISGGAAVEDAINITNGRLTLGGHNNGAGVWYEDIAGASEWFVGLSSDDVNYRFYNAPAAVDRVVIYANGTVQFNAYGAGLLRTNANGSISVDTNTYLTGITAAQVHGAIYATGGDANTYTTFGIYRNYAVNGPVAGHTTILNVMQADGNYGFQLGADTTSSADGLYFRSKDAAIGTWKQVASREWVTAQGYTTNTGTVTSVSGTGGYGGLTLTGTVTTSGSITLGGTPTGTWPISVSGNSATATTLATARTITLSGAVTGSANFDGSANITITTTATPDPTLTLAGDATGSATFTNLGNATLTVTVVDDSHTHDGRYYTETESDARFVNVTGDTVTGDLTVSGAALGVISTTAGSDAFYVDGVNGRLFTVTDSLDDSLFSVNTVAGLPVIEAFADNTVKLGPFTNPVTISSTGTLSIGGLQAATQSYVDTAITNLIGGAPGALDTLNELAAAINDDASYASTITSALALKAPLASPALTGTPTAPTAATATNSTQIATTAFVKNQGYITGYTETDTLATVTGRGATTSSKVFFTHHTNSDPLSAVEINGGGTHTGLYINPAASSQAHIRFGTNGTLKWQIRAPFQDSADTALKFYSWVSGADKFEFQHSGNAVFNGGTVWTSANDGASSGLDADLLDGNHASAFYLATNPSGYITGAYLDDYTRGAYRVISDYGSNSTWYIRSNGQFVFGTAHDWTASFRLNIDNGSGYGNNGSWAYFGQQDSNTTNGTWRGVRIRKFANGNVDGDLSAGAYYIGDTRKDTNWDTAYGWGNHASAGYLTSYTETDTLATVTGRGATTSTALTLNGNISVGTSAKLSFGSQVRQMIDLWSTSYGIGIQSNTQYFRTGSGFAWFRGGIHSDAANDAGSGGVVAMHMDSSSNLTVTGNITAANFSGTSSGTNTGDQTTISGNAGSATVLQTARTLTIGATGKTFNGSANVSWSLAEIGALGATAKAADSELLDGIDSSGFVRQLADTSSPNYQNPSSRRVDPNALNPTNEHYAVTTFGNGSNVTGQLATHFQTGNLYSRGYNTTWSAWRRYWNDTDFSSTNVSNWNTAYGWGNHSGLYLGISDTAADSNKLGGLAAASYYLASNPSGYITSSSNITGTSAGVVRTVSGTTSAELVRGNMGDNDQARILVGATASNAGYLEIATADDGTEPIYVRQYTGVFSTLTRTATILDGSGNTTLPGNLTVGGTITENSSIRYKENIVDLEFATEKIEQLRPVRYNKIGTEQEEIGLIAEEVAEIYPEVVTYNEEGQPDGVNYTRLSVILLKSVQELAERINKLENK